MMNAAPVPPGWAPSSGQTPSSGATASVGLVCRGSAGRVQSSPLTGDLGAYTKGDRVWLRITVYVLGRRAGEYGIVQMPGSRGYGIAPLFPPIAGINDSL